jgi:FKBP-type peptidyl-prolyl cis-trans isomerase FkpA
MHCTRMFLALIVTVCITGCGNPQTVTETTDATTPTAPARPAVQQASSSTMSKDFQTTASGLKYRIVRAGDPSKKPTRADSVLAHYQGWLDNGTIFDSSYDRGEPTSFPLSGVIEGWTEGLQLIGEGGEIQLEIPGKLGYGPQGMPPAGIGPNATLHFKVELIEVL